MKFNKEFLEKAWVSHQEKAELIAEYFYDILFHENEGTDELFKSSEMHFQKMEFKKAFNYILANLDRPEKLKEYLNDSGIRHVCYGIEPKHYVVVEQTLLKTFERIFKESWTDETRDQWSALIDQIIKLMKEGATSVRPELMEQK